MAEPEKCTSVTINIGTDGVKVEDGSKAFKEEVNKRFTTVEAEVKQNRSASQEAKAAAEGALAESKRATNVVQKQAARLGLQPRVIRLDKNDPIPEGTPMGTIVVRTLSPISHAPHLFPPVYEWPKVNASEAGDGVYISSPGGIIATGLEQLRTSEGVWELTLRYSYPGGNFGETEGQCPLYTVRTFNEEGQPTRTDQGAKIADLAVQKGENQKLTLRIEPRVVDDKMTQTWGIWLEAPITSLTVHDLVLTRVS